MDGIDGSCVAVSFRPEYPPAFASQYARPVLGSLVVHRSRHTKVICVACLHFTFLPHYAVHTDHGRSQLECKCKPYLHTVRKHHIPLTSCKGQLQGIHKVYIGMSIWLELIMYA